MSDTNAKPRLLFFQYKYDERLAPFLLVHKNEHVTCLSQFFDVTVIQEDCDYERVCDQYQADLALFESGVPFARCARPVVRNIHTCPQVPRLGLLHSDAFCEARAGFLSDMDHWGIETFFAIAATAGEHNPALADKLFVWPNFVNSELYRDYGQSKNIPVLFTGNNTSLYPWRQKVLRAIPQHYPSLICPHPGYTQQKQAARILIGEPYAKLLNASWFVPACGTVAREIVRKHFEAPACKACLVSEKSAALDAAGFIDMKNCVFAEDTEVVEKLGYLFDHCDELAAIIDAGHALVHSRHTMRHRDQILQWLILHKSLGPHQRIIQTSPFGPLTVVDRASGEHTRHLQTNGGLVTLLRNGYRQLWSGDYAAAEHSFLRCVSYYRYMPEPMFGLALCKLLQGRPKEALKWIAKPLEVTLADYQAVDPDPVEWAYFIVVLLSLGKIDEAAKRSEEFTWLRHPELDFVRWVASCLAKGDARGTPALEAGDAQRLSLHEMPARSNEERLQQLCTILSASSRPDLAERAAKLNAAPTPLCGQREVRSTGTARPDEAMVRASRMHKKPWVYATRNAKGVFNRKRMYSKACATARGCAKRTLRMIGSGCDRLLPYKYSARKTDELYEAMYLLITQSEINNVLVIGATQGKGVIEPLLAGMPERQQPPVVFCIGTGSCVGRGPANVLWSKLARTKPDGFWKVLDEHIAAIKQQSRIEHFDLIVIDGSQLSSELPEPGTAANLCLARRVVIEGVTRAGCIHAIYEHLLQCPSYKLVACNHELRAGYAIFETLSGAADGTTQERDPRCTLRPKPVESNETMFSGHC